mmetsp:Transcript_6743/g.14019  ORF Transcript_6743/g.14019 Transcript_6743/m.14019 type:complete len:120 (-) Transcript_6743:40-399(-)
MSSIVVCPHRALKRIAASSPTEGVGPVPSLDLEIDTPAATASSSLAEDGEGFRNARDTNDDDVKAKFFAKFFESLKKSRRDWAEDKEVKEVTEFINVGKLTLKEVDDTARVTKTIRLKM